MTGQVAYLLLLIGFVAPALQGQTLNKVDETEQYTEYELRNDSLRVSMPHQLTVPYGNGQTFQILERELVSVTLADTLDYYRPLMQELGSTDDPILETKNPGMMRGDRVASLLIHVARRDRADTTRFQVARHLSFRVFKDDSDTEAGTRSRIVQTPDAEDSPLASGEWYRIPFEEEGIYQLDEGYLEELGVAVDEINPHHIQLWTTDGYPLPHRNDAPRPELAEIPIIVEGEDNGSFDGGDRVIFYGNSVNQISYDASSQQFTHQKHHSDRQNNVFLTIGSEQGRRLEPESYSNPSRTITEFRDFIWKEEHRHKAESGLKSGLEWFGQVFEAGRAGEQEILSRQVPGINTNEPVELEIGLAARSIASSQFTLRFNGRELSPVSITAITNYSGPRGIAARETSSNYSLSNLSAPDELLGLQAAFSTGDSGGRGWIDYIRIHLTRELVAREGKLMFATPEDGDPSEVATYTLQNFEERPYVLDISNPVDPVRLSVEASGGEHEVNYHTSPGTRMLAQSELNEPEAGERIGSQNLRGLQQHPDYIVITHERLLDQAEQLADYRAEESNLTPVVVTQQQIMNEFNGGVRDFAAMRDYVKMIYDRAQDTGIDEPKYLLFFGNATYDNKGVIPGVRMENLVMTYQSRESVDRIGTFATDDWFVLLEDGEGEWSGDRVDMGVGRIPVQTPGEGDLVIDKIQSYEAESHRQDWRSMFTFVADDDRVPRGNDDDLHIVNADQTAAEIDRDETGIRLDKIYQIDYPVESTAAGARVPQATRAMIDRINNGTLVMNFSGHGNERWLTDQRIFSIDDIPRLQNEDRLPIMVTATCEFGRYDDSERYSGAEQMLLHEGGGVVAAMTTTRVVFTSRTPGGNNFGLNIELTREMVRRNDDGSPQSLGTIFRRTKNTTWGAATNNRKFSMLGDPAMQIGLPEEQMEITHINREPIETQDELRLRALDRVHIEGRAVDHTGQPIPEFNGRTTLRLYDAERFVSYPADRDWVPGRCTLPDCGYFIQNDVLFNGQFSVEGGHFSGEFIIPKNISYSEKPGRLHMYASGEQQDAVGSFSDFVINELNPDAEDDGEGPEVDIYLNDESFFSGDLVNENPMLYVELFDDYGINTSGGIGQDLVAVLRENPQGGEETIVLNDFYQSELDDFRSGRVEYPIQELEEGRYELLVRAWDVFNNPGESTVEFEVAPAEELVVQDVFNYPNPMNNHTNFIFEHNQQANALDVRIRIYTPGGAPVATINREGEIPAGSLLKIPWDGRDDDGDRLANGTYIYHVRVRSETINGTQSSDHIERLVIIR